MRDIGKNIRSLREQKGMTQEELGERLFVTRQTISNYETGRSRPDVEMLVKIAQALETDVTCVLYGPPAPPDRKRAVRRLAVCAVLLAVLALLWFVLLPEYRAHVWAGEFEYHGRGTAIRLGVPALAFLLGGWGLLQLLHVTSGLKPVKGAWTVWGRRAALVVLLFCGAMMIPYLVWLVEGDLLQASGVSVTRGFPSVELPFQGLYNAVFRWMVNLHDKAPFLYALPGMALWLCGFPVGKQKTSPVE